MDFARANAERCSADGMRAAAEERAARRRRQMRRAEAVRRAAKKLKSEAAGLQEAVP